MIFIINITKKRGIVKMNTVPLSIEFLMGKPASLLHRNFGKLIRDLTVFGISSVVGEQRAVYILVGYLVYVGVIVRDIVGHRFERSLVKLYIVCLKRLVKLGRYCRDILTNEIKSAADYYINDFSELLLI